MLFGPIVSFQFGCTESRKPHSFIALNLSSIPHFDLHHRHICGSQMLEEKSVFSSPNHFFIIRRANLIVATQNPKYCIFCFNLSLSMFLSHSHSVYLFLFLPIPFNSMRMQSFHVYVLNFQIEYIIKIILKMVQFGSFNRCKRIYSFSHSHTNLMEFVFVPST